VHATGGVDADDSGLTHAVSIEDFGDAAGLLDSEHEVLAIFSGAEGGAAHGAGPDGRHEGTHLEALGCNLVSHRADLAFGSIRIGVRVEDEEIDTVELAAADFGANGKFEHAIE
jgi:hypothetical protein